MPQKRLKFWLFGLVSLLFASLVPSAFAAMDFSQTFAIIPSVINDLFRAFEPYVGQTGFQRFMYWMLIFIVVFYAGQRLPITSNDDEGKKLRKRLVTVLAAILATAGAYAANPQLMQSFGSLVSLVIPFGLIFGALFAWIYNPTFMQNRPRVRHLIRFLVYLFGLSAASYISNQMSNTLTNSYLGNLAFQLIALFFAVMVIYELVMIFVAGGEAAAHAASGAAHGAAALGAGAHTAAGNLRNAATGIGNAFNTLLGRTPPPIPAGVAPYLTFPNDITAFEVEIRNLQGVNAQLQAMINTLLANPALRGNAPFIRGVRAVATRARAIVQNGNNNLATITANPGLRYLPIADQDHVTHATADFAQQNHEFLARYGWLQTHMY